MLVLFATAVDHAVTFPVVALKIPISLNVYHVFAVKLVLVVLAKDFEIL